MRCEVPTAKYPDGRTGTKVGFAAHKRAGEQPCGPCEVANVSYMSEYGKTNKDRIAKYNRDRRDDRQDVIDRLKAVPCADCGGKFSPICMDFDHLGDKEFSISRASTRSIETVLAEVAKCEVVCANCHRIRTAERLVRKHAKKVS